MYSAVADFESGKIAAAMTAGPDTPYVVIPDHQFLFSADFKRAGLDLVLRDLEGMTSEEVGRVLGSRPATVRAQISAARTKVKAFCEKAFAGTGGVRP